MSYDNTKAGTEKNLPAVTPQRVVKPGDPATATTLSTVKPSGPVKPATAVKPVVPPLPPLFRRIDWLAFGLTTLLVFIGYFLTLAPEVTLEDSGELSVGSFYAGVPHPPGYPLWTIFTWLFTVLVPVANVAYRVAIASAVSGSLAAGMIALLVSRGSSMIIEGIEDLKGLPLKLENVICLISGLVSGVLLAYNGYMWSQCVIVEVYPFSVLSLMGVMCCILRWMYAPHQRRYIYFAWFIFGVCFTNHQTLILAAMGIEGAIIAGQPKLGRDLLFGNSVIYVIGLFVLESGKMGAFQPNPMVINLFHMVGLGSIFGCAWLTVKTKDESSLCTDILPVLAMFGLWAAGAAFYLFMPLTSMSNPPMNWGYPRTVEGFIHALTRGQYEKANPSNFFTNPGHFISQLGMYVNWATEEFNWVNLALAIIPIIFFIRMAKRERAWLAGLGSIWFCLAVILLILLNPTADKASQSLNKVFFAASFTIIAMFNGYGLTLIAAYTRMKYQQFRPWAIYGGAFIVVLALRTLYTNMEILFGDLADTKGAAGTLIYAIGKSFEANQYALPIQAGLLLVAVTVVYLLLNIVFRTRGQVAIILALFLLLPANSIMSHWSDNEQRGHWFGYWFGHDMFTPPVFDANGKATYDPQARAQALKGTNASLIYPEMTRDAVLFGGTDPGRFCPTYMIFCESFIPHDKQPVQDQKFDRRDVYIITQNALADGTYLEYIRAHYDRSTQIDPPFFQDLLRSKTEVEQNYTTNFLASLAYNILDKPFLTLGAKIEKRRRAEGVYPPKEIYTPSPEDSQNCFNSYMQDAQQRYSHDQQFPNEPRQIRAGEEVRNDNGRVSVSGQVAVMAINGLLTKVIFDHCPSNEFFVEESFPLDWMYPYLTPFGVIMKINRQPLDELSDDVIRRDHEFWCNYSDRFIGNWINYNTSVKEIADFVEKVYLHRDFNGFKGDRAFVRDDDAQKAFSKLRSSIGGIYNYRVSHSRTPAEQQRMIKEADFAFRQSFAFCPYSPEAVFRYVPLLVNSGRVDDAILVAETCHKLDPNNGSVSDLLNNLNSIKSSHAGGAVPPAQPMTAAQMQGALQQMEKDVHDHPTSLQSVANLIGAYVQFQQYDKANKLLDTLMASPQADANTIMFAAQNYARFTNYNGLEHSLERLTVVEADSPEAWYDLAGIKAILGKAPDSMKALRVALDKNAKRLAANPKAPNLAESLKTDPRFGSLRGLAEFQQLESPKAEK